MPKLDAADLPHAGHAAVVTGGGSGIGLACAKALAADGASVTICGRNADRLAAAVTELEALTVGAAVAQSTACDVTDEQSVAQVVELAARPTNGRLHVAIASAGTGTLAPVIATEKSEWDRVLATNVTGAFLLFKHAGAAIAHSGGGAMVGISSIAAAVTHPYMAPYSVSKAALDMLVKVTADELGRAGVRVNSVRPSVVDTDLTEMLTSDEATMDSYYAQMPIPKLGTVEDVAAAVSFLCGPGSTWITGQSLSVDGGHHLRAGPDFEPAARALFSDAAVDATI